MKSIRIAHRLRPALALATAFSLPALASAQIVLQQWTFNDVAGTGLPAVTNSAGSASFATGIPGVTTDGAGVLTIVSDVFGASSRSFADIPDLSTGLYHLDVTLSGWNLLGAGDLEFIPVLEIGLSANTTIGNASRAAHILFRVFADDTVATLAGVAAGTGATSTAALDDQTFGLTRATPITFRLAVNFDTDSYSVSHSDNAFGTPAFGSLSSDQLRTGAFVQIRAVEDFTVGGTGGFVGVDRITLTAVPEPSAFAAIAGLAILGFAASRRRRR